MRTKKNTTTNKPSTKQKPSKNGFILDNIDVDLASYNYETIDATEAINKRMGIYGFNVNLERSIPNVRDGLTFSPSKKLLIAG